MRAAVRPRLLLIRPLHCHIERVALLPLWVIALCVVCCVLCFVSYVLCVVCCVAQVAAANSIPEARIKTLIKVPFRARAVACLSTARHSLATPSSPSCLHSVHPHNRRTAGRRPCLGSAVPTGRARWRSLCT